MNLFLYTLKIDFWKRLQPKSTHHLSAPMYVYTYISDKRDLMFMINDNIIKSLSIFSTIEVRLLLLNFI